MKNVISQSLGLDLVNINVYAKVYQNIPLSSRDRAIFTFSEFEPRSNSEKVKMALSLKLGQPQMTFDNHLGYILSISMLMQILSKYSKRFKSYRHFSTFFTNRPGTKSSQTVQWQNQMFDYRALYEIQLQVSVDFLRVVQFGTGIYLSLSIPKHHQSAVAKFRCGVAPIRLETGRYENLPEKERKCFTCDTVENEYHVICECPVYDDLRKLLFSKACDVIQNFDTLDSFSQMYALLHNWDIVKITAKTLFDILTRKCSLIYR